MAIYKKIHKGGFIFQEYELLSALRKNPLRIMAGDDICSVAAGELESQQKRIEELEKAINSHNQELESMCNNKAMCGRTPEHRRCPDCPTHYLIEGVLCTTHEK